MKIMFMKDKNYGLSKSPNEGVEDKSPEWMDEVFKKLSGPQDNRGKKEHPFYGIDDPILNPNKLGLKDKE